MELSLARYKAKKNCIEGEKKELNITTLQLKYRIIFSLFLN